MGAMKPLAAVAGGALALGLLAAPAAMAARAADAAPGAASAGNGRACALGGSGKIKHVIYLQFDNTHFSRDNPNVPSDLEQMPNLLHFMTGNGTLISHEHTPLIAHTADDIVTSESGLYGDRHGMPVANEYNYYTPSGKTDTAGSFAYWRDPIVDYSTPTGAPVGDSTTTLVGQNGKTPPAPWVSYTRAGCNFGSVAAANTELENTTPDVPVVFGANSPDAREAENPNLQNKATADYEGLSVHCARSSAVCASHHSVSDPLPDEPGGYQGYRALFGAKYIDSLLSTSGPVRNLDGQVIEDSSGDIGFPGYDGMTGANALAYTLDMQTHGVPVTFTYLTDLHDARTGSGGGLGPGDPTYEAQLRQENTEFGKFFADLSAHGITKQNTLFVVTSDEGDHFVGSAPAPSNCNGVTITCSYKRVGEVDGYLPAMFAGKGVTTPFDVAADSAPIIYSRGQPGRAEASVRTLERAATTLTAKDIATGKTVKVTRYMADPVEMKLLHMITGDPKRTATMALFGNTDFWLNADPTICGAGVITCEPSGGDAWNHGDVAPEINTTWLGLVGPGVAERGVDNSTWSDHTDIVPTMAALLGLRLDYAPQGRVLVEALDHGNRIIDQDAGDRGTLLRLGDVYSQINAPVGAFGLDTLRASTRALASDSPGDATYTRIENALMRLGDARDGIAAQMSRLLLGATLYGHRLDQHEARELIAAGHHLLAEAAALAA